MQHEARCPEISPPDCAEQDIPAHLHDQRIRWLRLHPGLNVGLGKGWQLQGQLPFDVRVLTIDYRTLDGQPFDPPYGDIHHRNEVLWGLVDGRIAAWRYAAPGGGWILGGGVGTTLPFGRTEDDPFALAAQGETHQHFQLGSGTFDPVVGLVAIQQGMRWGAWASVDARLPVYANGRGYRPPTSLNVSVGPTVRFLTGIQLMATAEGAVETVERWSGAPYGGRAAVGAGLGALAAVRSDLVLQVQGRAALWEAAFARHEEPLTQPLLITAGLSWTPGLAPGRE